MSDAILSPLKKGRKVKKENRIVFTCHKCNKPVSYDKYRGYPFGNLCRQCFKKGR